MGSARGHSTHEIALARMQILQIAQPGFTHPIPIPVQNLLNEPRCNGCPNGTVAAWYDEMARFTKEVRRAAQRPTAFALGEPTAPSPAACPTPSTPSMWLFASVSSCCAGGPQSLGQHWRGRLLRLLRQPCQPRPALVRLCGGLSVAAWPPGCVRAAGGTWHGADPLLLACGPASGLRRTEWAAEEGQDFIADHSSPAIDFATIHAWVGWVGGRTMLAHWDETLAGTRAASIPACWFHTRRSLEPGAARAAPPRRSTTGSKWTPPGWCAGSPTTRTTRGNC
jgi:hypothetical protein